MTRQPDRQAIQNHSMRPPAFNDRMMWIVIRQHVLAFAKALHDIPDRTPLIIAARASLLGVAKAIALRWDIRDRTD